MPDPTTGRTARTAAAARTPTAKRWPVAKKNALRRVSERGFCKNRFVFSERREALRSEERWAFFLSLRHAQPQRNYGPGGTRTLTPLRVGAPKTPASAVPPQGLLCGV